MKNRSVVLPHHLRSKVSDPLRFPKAFVSSGSDQKPLTWENDLIAECIFHGFRPQIGTISYFTSDIYFQSNKNEPV